MFLRKNFYSQARQKERLKNKVRASNWFASTSNRNLKVQFGNQKNINKLEKLLLSIASND